MLELRETVDTEQRRDRARARSMPMCSPCRWPPRRRAAGCRRPLGPVHALLLELPTLPGDEPPVLARSRCSPIRGRGRSRSGARRRRELPARGAGARARDHGRDARRSAGRADEPLGPRQPRACSSTAARSRRRPTLRVLSGANAAAVQRAGRRVGDPAIRQRRAGRRAHLRTVAPAARRARQRMGDGRAAAGRRAVRAARPACACRSRAASKRSGGGCSFASSRRTATMAIRARSRSTRAAARRVPAARAGASARAAARPAA